MTSTIYPQIRTDSIAELLRLSHGADRISGSVTKITRRASQAGYRTPAGGAIVLADEVSRHNHDQGPVNADLLQQRLAEHGLAVEPRLEPAGEIARGEPQQQGLLL